MKRIGLSQRVEIVTSVQERRDCLDQAWARLLWSMSFVPVPLCNAITSDLRTYLDRLGLDGVILTGGNDLADSEGGRATAPERDEFEFGIIHQCQEKQLPLLGVCRGMQIINRYFGGTVARVEGHAGSEHTVSAINGLDQAGQMDRANSFHDYGILPGGLAGCMTATATASDGSIEAFRHQTWYDCQGIMWHPERVGPNQEADRTRIATLIGQATCRKQ